MVMPGLGVDPAKLAEMQRTTRHIVAVLRIDYKEEAVTIKMSSGVLEARALIPQLLEQFADTFAQQLNSYFAITGKIVEVNKTK